MPDPCDEPPVCPWEVSLDTICPKHGVPLRDCPPPHLQRPCNTPKTLGSIGAVGSRRRDVLASLGPPSMRAALPSPRGPLLGPGLRNWRIWHRLHARAPQAFLLPHDDILDRRLGFQIPPAFIAIADASGHESGLISVADANRQEPYDQRDHDPVVHLSPVRPVSLTPAVLYWCPGTWLPWCVHPALSWPVMSVAALRPAEGSCHPRTPGTLIPVA